VRVEFLERFALFDGAEGVSAEIVLNTDSSTGQTFRLPSINFTMDLFENSRYQATFPACEQG